MIFISEIGEIPSAPSSPSTGGRDVEIHLDPTRACRQHRRRTGRGCARLAGDRSRESDPIFALIEEYRRLYDEYGRVIDAQAAFAVGTPDWKNADDRVSQTSTAYTATIRKLCQTAPTTLAGLAAVLSFIIDAEDQGDDLLNTFAEDKNKDSDAKRETCIYNDLARETCIGPFLRAGCDQSSRWRGRSHE